MGTLFQYTDQKNPKRIMLRSRGGQSEEGNCGQNITPGQLVKLDGQSDVVVHNTVGGYAERAFAIEDALQARTLDDVYAPGDKLQYHLAEPGDIVYTFLEDQDSVNVGDLLTSAGNGDLRKVVTTDIPVAVALEKVDNSASANITHQRIRARVL